MGFWSWLTGRDPKESDLYANYEKVDDVTSKIKTLASTNVGNSQQNIYEAFNQLNNVHGLAEYVGTIEIGNFDAVFSSVKSTVDQLATQISDKADSIKEYEEAPWYKKVASTLTMGIFKVGEGLLSVVEDLGDGVVSIVGWTAGKLGAKNFADSAANFVKKEWSHDAFNFYYKSDFAKASAFTEDSAIAGGLKIAGKTVGYLYAGGAVAGFAKGAGAAAKAGSMFSKVATGMGKLASSTTWGATAVGFLGGVGNGTDEGLNAGLDFNQAFGNGIKSGVIQGTLAFAGGKLGEKMNKSAQIKKATADGDTVTAEALKGQKLSNFEGYTDSITKAGQDFGSSLYDVQHTGVQSKCCC